MKHILYTVIILSVLVLNGCVKDLELEPIDSNVATADNALQTEEDYKMALAKIYAAYALSSQKGGGGGELQDSDIQGIDPNFGNYLRLYWNLQELPTDEAIMAWNDQTIKSFHWHTWAPNDVFITAFYYRIFYSVGIANEFIRTSNAAIGSAEGSFKTNLEYYNAEARFLRAFSYFHAIDMFGNIPFITEQDEPGAFSPQQILRPDLFDYIESELLDLESKLAEPRTNEYGRVDKAAAWMLLAKLYLNAEVYTGTEHNTEAITYTQKVIESGYELDDTHQDIFLADNNTSPEIIYPIAFDGQNTQQYGGMTFLVSASRGGGMPDYGSDGAWGGIRTIKELPQVFDLSESDFSPSDPEPTIADSRAMFFFNTEVGWEWEVNNVGTFLEGIGVIKYKNIDVNGIGGEDLPTGHATFVSIDFPVFRLADAYLMYAEAVVRGGSGGSRISALQYVNDLRERAYGDDSNNISDTELTLDFLLDERARELYWEAHRRTDLIRFGVFTGNDYVWTWKGNTKEGTGSSTYRDLYPIPANDLNANPNLVQNDGYAK